MSGASVGGVRNELNAVAEKLEDKRARLLQALTKSAAYEVNIIAAWEFSHNEAIHRSTVASNSAVESIKNAIGELNLAITQIRALERRL